MSSEEANSLLTQEGRIHDAGVVNSGYQSTDHPHVSRCGRKTSEEPFGSASPSSPAQDKVCGPRVVKNKGALLILFISAVVDAGQTSALNYALMQLLMTNAYIGKSTSSILYLIFFVTGTAVPQLFYPMAGWIADVHFGRYRVIRLSLWCMWLGQCLLSFMLLPYLLMPSESASVYMTNAIETVLFPLTFVIMNIGLAGFQANAMQFGIDQMVDSSSDEVSTFVHWYYWSIHIGGGTLSMILTPALTGYTLSTVLAGVDALLLGVALLSWYKLKKWLIVEPKGKNPIKTMYDIILFAHRHKTPLYRSALTYWDDRPPTRLDLGKSKYGGPFTTEEVEDVKTFFAITVVLASLGLYIIVDYTLEPYNQLKHEILVSSALYTDGDLTTSVSTSGLILVSVPIYELVVYPLMKRCLNKPTILRRIGIGMVVGIVTILTQIAIFEAIDTNQCFLITSTALSNSSISSTFTAIPFTFSTVSELLVYIAAFEFICAQSPYRFRSMLIGAFYAIQGLCTVIAMLIALTVSSLYKSYGWKYPCSRVYFLVMLLISTVGMALYLLAGKRYKQRERDEHIDHHVIAENYYSKLTN